MRLFALLSAFALIGCAGNSLPIEGGSSAGTTATNGNNTGTTGNNNTGTNGNNTGTTGSTTAANTGTNGSNTGTTGSTTGTGGQGDACKSTCDCEAGLACFQNQCTNASIMGVTLYCCDAATCPAGQFCQSADGSFGMCGSSSGGTTGANGCSTACDCPSGQACFQGGCITPPQGKLYCCDDTNACPSGGFCQSSGGGLMMCGGGANTGANGGMNGGTNGGMSMCMMTMCKSDMDCSTAGCGSCGRRGTCRPPGM